MIGSPEGQDGVHEFSEGQRLSVLEEQLPSAVGASARRPWGGDARRVEAEVRSEVGQAAIQKDVPPAIINQTIPGPSKGCPMDYPTLPIGFHWAPLRGSWYSCEIFKLLDLNHQELDYIAITEEGPQTPAGITLTSHHLRLDGRTALRFASAEVPVSMTAYASTPSRLNALEASGRAKSLSRQTARLSEPREMREAQKNRLCSCETPSLLSSGD